MWFRNSMFAIMADARLIFHHFLSGLAWIHNLYLKGCCPSLPARASTARLWPAEGPFSTGKSMRKSDRQSGFGSTGTIIILKRSLRFWQA